MSEGCRNCYADTLSKRNPSALGIWGPNGTRIVAAESYWREPLKWDAAAKAAGERHRVFCASLADVFEDWRKNVHRGFCEGTRDPAVLWWRSDIGICCGGQTTVHRVRGERLAKLADVRARLFDLIRRTPNLDWLLLTKRPENWRNAIEGALISSEGGDPDDLNYFADHDGDFERNDLSIWLNNWTGGEFPPNVWLGTSVENQEAADTRIPDLLKCPAVVRFLSCEPLLGPIDLTGDLWGRSKECDGCSRDIDCRCMHEPRIKIAGDRSIGWVIVGGESGAGARECNIAWMRSIVQQCRDAGVACFVKQYGAKPVRADGGDCSGCMPGGCTHQVGTNQHPVRIALQSSKGGDPAEWPEDLRVRQMPAGVP